MVAYYNIHQLPNEERPRERLLKHGVDAVSNIELIAIVLGNGTKGKNVIDLAKDLLSRFGSLTELAEATINELCEVKGMGVIKAIQLKAALGIGKRVVRDHLPAKYKIQYPSDAYKLLKDELENEKQEHFVVILMNTKGYVITHEIISSGTLSQTIVHPREVFYPAIRHKAAGMVLAHNNPSGDPTPSEEDRKITTQLVAMGQMMNIPILDHIIIGKGDFVSLKREGVISQ